MKKILSVMLVVLLSLTVVGCKQSTSQTKKDQVAVERQQGQYSKSQPVPGYIWSLERHLLTELYNLRNMKAITHSVWRGDTSQIEGHCASIGFGIPYDTSLTNPLKGIHGQYRDTFTTVEQAEPNGIFASKNTNATWVMCAGKMGNIEPVYVETKVTVYPYPVKVDYVANTVTKAGKASVTITKGN
ncbi:MAG: hypothetical protein KUG81_11085 [Gammaproteobacteria bacterium]|nr:hypothetical protein [Gammaproteobacteria bacterium]